MMKYLLLLLSFAFFTSHLLAQIDKEPLPTTDATVIEVNNSNSLFGKVVDIQTNKGISGATVQLFASKSDSIANKTRDSLIAVMLTKPNGDFHFAKIPILSL